MDISVVHDAIAQTLCFIEKYTEIGSSHMVKFFTKDYWDLFIGNSAKKQLLEMSKQEIDLMATGRLNPIDNISSHDSDGKIKDLNSYFLMAQACRLSSLKVLLNRDDAMELLNSGATNIHKEETDVDNFTEPLKISSKEFMCSKKSHEVELMSPLVHALCKKCNTNRVLDIGSGKGYFSSYLSLKHKIHVTGIDCVESHSMGAMLRASKYLKYWEKHLRKSHGTESDFVMNFSSVTAHINPNNEIKDVVLNGESKTDSEETTVITGLHTCGNLCSDIVSSFVNQKDIKGLCVIGCCYHLLSENEEEQVGFPMSHFLRDKQVRMGRNKLMLALKVPEKMVSDQLDVDRRKAEKSLFYRAVLTVILKECFNIDDGDKDRRVGKIFSKSKDFLHYIRRSFEKLEINGDCVSDERILEFLTRYEPKYNQLVAFCRIREVYAPAVEALIVLDKLCYLLENKEKTSIEQCFVTEIFDALMSPRRYAIVAFKNNEIYF